MRAIVVDRWMEPDALQVRDVPQPVVGAGDVGIEVHSAGVNFFDILLVQGKYQLKPEFPFVPGGEIAGVVTEIGADVTGVAVGDRVYAGLPFGGYAEHASVDASRVRPVPGEFDFDEAAAFPIVYPTSHSALVLRANLQPGETVLVHAAAGGVGIAAVQIAEAMGAFVIGTAGGAEKVEVARRAGADVAIDYRADDFVPAVLEATDGRGADVIYDSVGGDTTSRSLKCIAWNGRLLVVGFASGTIPELRLNRVLLKNVAIVGVHWGAYALHEPARVPETFEALELMTKDGGLRPILYDSFPLAKLPDALEALGSRRSYGKIVLRPQE